MDDRYAYMLNSLWSKYYDLGRVVRFREVSRGRQATCYEVLTGEQHEYMAYLFPAAFDAAQLTRMCQAINALDKERFSVVPMMAAHHETWIVGGPQGTWMAVGLATSGQYLLPDQWSPHDMSQLGLRLAWMHRLLAEQMPPAYGPKLGEMLATALVRPKDRGGERIAALDANQLKSLAKRIAAIEEVDEARAIAAETAASAAGERTAAGGAAAGGRGWCHGDVQPAALLMDDDHQLRTIVDWGLLHAGDSLEDVIDAFVHWCVGSDGVIRGDCARAMMEAYRTLRKAQSGGWDRAVTSWCAQRVVDATHDRRPLPRGFATYLREPGGLVEALELCEAR